MTARDRIPTSNRSPAATRPSAGPDEATERCRGFVLQPGYRIERHPSGGRAIVELYGRLDSGESFLIRDRRPRPSFWIRTDDAESARQLGARDIEASERVDFAGEPLSELFVGTPPDAPILRDRLQDAGIRCFEADVRFAMRYLIDRDVRGALRIRGKSQPGPRIDRVFDEPTIEPDDWVPSHLRTLSFDIETDMRGERVFALALEGCGTSEVLLVPHPEAKTVPRDATVVDDERELIRAFEQRVEQLDPDVLTGWNISDFDVPVLERAAQRVGLGVLTLGRGHGRLRRFSGKDRREATRVTVPGRLVLDGLHLLRTSFVRMERQTLDFVARQVLGEGKTLAGAQRGETIQEWHRSDPERLVEYNRHDARLVLEVLDRLQLIELAVERSRLTGLPPDRVSGSVAAFDFLYLSRLRKRDVAAPSVGAHDFPATPQSGGHVLRPLPGLYENVLVLDFRSLYPSLIRTFQIDPLGYLGQDDDRSTGDSLVDAIRAPNGAWFRRDIGILTEVLDELFPRRAAAQQAGNQVASQAIKILMNSFYGVLGTSVCRFYNPHLANAITSFGRELLLWCKDRLESAGHPVLYGDTDSLFVESGAATTEQAQRLGRQLVEGLDEELARYVASRWRCESRLELEFEKVYRRLFLPPLRHGGGGAMKRYVGLTEIDGEDRVVFTGMEAVRSDQTELAKQAQAEIYRRLFFGEPLEQWLAGLVARLRAGELDDRLVYRKSLRKDPSAYTATTPPHVAAARKLSGQPGREIEYVITTSGPEPAEEQGSPFDHQHYVDKQIRPIAEPVLEILDLDFETVIGDATQIRLF